MVMDRKQLAKAIDVGTKSTLNAFEIAKNIRDLGNEIEEANPQGKLFKNVQLNNVIIFKVMERSEDGTKYGVDTLMYFPYNHENVYEGGDSVLFSDPLFWEKINSKTGLEIENEEMMEVFNYDKKIVEMLKNIPTLDPFLLKNKAIQLGIDEYIHEDYFNISLDEWNRIQAPIRLKIKALVEKALGMGDGDSKGPRLSQIESHVTKFLNKIWEARDVDGIEDFVLSLDIKPEKAPELFFAWKALCYYEVQFRGLMRELRQFYSWVGNPVDSTPTDIAQMPFDDREELLRNLRQLRYVLRNGFKRVYSIFQEYEKSHQQFIAKGEPERFKVYLSRADEHYMHIAGCLSGHAHAINLWRDATERHGSFRLPGPAHAEVFQSFLQMFNVQNAAYARSDKVAAAG